jgi:hypothetical protein
MHVRGGVHIDGRTSAVCTVVFLTVEKPSFLPGSRRGGGERCRGWRGR